MMMIIYVIHEEEASSFVVVVVREMRRRNLLLESIFFCETRPDVRGEESVLIRSSSSSSSHRLPLPFITVLLLRKGRGQKKTLQPFLTFFDSIRSRRRSLSDRLGVICKRIKGRERKPFMSGVEEGSSESLI